MYGLKAIIVGLSVMSGVVKMLYILIGVLAFMFVLWVFNYIETQTDNTNEELKAKSLNTTSMTRLNYKPNLPDKLYYDVHQSPKQR